MRRFSKAKLVNSFTAFVCLTVLMIGCTGKKGQQELDQIEQAVRTGLECWQAGNKPEALKAGDRPMEFVDEDWQKGAKLAGFEILKTYLDTSGEPRCFVRLKIQSPNKPAAEIECNYKIRAEQSVIVARDPMG